LALAAGGWMLAGLPCFAAVPPERSVSPASRAMDFVSVFHDACMVYLGQDQALNAALEHNGFKLLSPAAAADFLQGAMGLAWAAPKRLGELVVALRDDGSCAVFAPKISASDVQADFDELARSMATPVPVARQPDQVVDSSEGPVNLHSYLQGRPGATSAIQLTLSTNTSASAHSQAVATLSLIERPPEDQAPTAPHQ
jgi:hypothetical protein